MASSAIANAVNAPASGRSSWCVVNRRLTVDAIPLSCDASDAGWYDAACRLGDRREGVVVERGLNAIAVDLDRRAVSRADPDGFDVHPGVLRSGRRHRCRVGVALIAAVGEQHDRRRTPVAESRHGAVLADRHRLAGDGRQRGEDRGGQRGAAGDLQTLDRGRGLGVVGTGLIGRQRAGLEGDDADIDAARLGLDECGRRLLRRIEPGGSHVGRRHAVRHVHRDDHRAGGARHWHGRRGAGHGDREHRDTGDAQPQAEREATFCCAGDNSRGSEGPLAPTNCHHCTGDQRGRYECAEHEPPRRRDAHARRQCVLATTCTRVSTRSRSVSTRCNGTFARRMVSFKCSVSLVDTGPIPDPEQRIAGVDDQLLTGLGVLDDDQAGVGQLVVGSRRAPAAPRRRGGAPIAGVACPTRRCR